MSSADFVNGLLRVEQRRAADRVIAQIERKLAKASYQKLLERYG